MKQLLRAPLPDLKLSGSSRCSSDAEPDRKTHPTNVLHWEGWKQEVRERVDAATSVSWTMQGTACSPVLACQDCAAEIAEAVDFE